MTSFKKIFLSKNPKYLDKVYNRNDYDKTFVTPKAILHWSGIKMTHTITELQGKYWSVYYWFEFVNIFAAMCLEFLGMLDTARGGTFDDAVKIFRMMPCNGYTVLSLIKSFNMVRYRPVYENLIDEIGGMWPDGAVGEEEHKIISSALKQINFVVKGYYYCNHYLLVSFLCPPFFQRIKGFLGREWEMMLHFFYWLPFNPNQPVYFEILLTIQTWHAIIVIWLNMSGDLLFCLFLSHITTQLDLLSVRIKKLVLVSVDRQLPDHFPLGMLSKDTERLSAEQEIKEQQQELAEIVKRHHALIRLSKDVEDMYSFSLLVNFLNSSIFICFCGFCSVVVEKWNETAYKSFLLTTLSQIWFLCWYGQKLLDSSEGVSDALYKCGWYNASKKVKTSILIMLHRYSHTYDTAGRKPTDRLSHVDRYISPLLLTLYLVPQLGQHLEK
ncbi:odorant receptor 67c-like [Bombyx mandarina]|uniref:Odorant receptor n=1 Tax=Bombyx mandarina TaxID=7092 RepID=A0A6J2JRR0_BOMMA|nr:odorant receptor 67c-like [Bombyx mandarina]